VTVPRYIGGPFEIPAQTFSRSPASTLQAHFGLEELDHAFTASGRSALAAGLERLGLEDGEVVLPDYLCADAVYPVLERRGLTPWPFPVAEGLRQDPGRVLEALASARRPRAVLLVAYFGLVDPEATARAVQAIRPDLPVILDSVQDLAGLAHARARSDWARWQAFSLHKFLPVPHGGLIVGQGAAGPGNNGWPAHAALAFSAGLLRGLFLDGAIHSPAAAAWETAYVSLNQAAEAELPVVPAPMPELTRLLLGHLDVAAALEQRRVNYSFLRERLAGSARLRPAVPDAPAAASPMAFPVLVQGVDRDDLRRALRAQGMFCPVHWPASDDALSRAGPAARALARESLSLPLDQRYTPADLDRLVAAAEDFRP